MFPNLFFQCFHLFFPMLCQDEGEMCCLPWHQFLPRGCPSAHPTPPHLTAADRISTANQAGLTSLGSYTFQAFPNKGNLPPATYARNPSFHRPWRLWPVHLFLSFLFLFQISCLCWKWVEFVSIYWMTAQKLSQCSPFFSKWWGFLSSKYHIRWSWYEDQPSKALSIHVLFFRGVFEIVTVNVWWHCARIPIVIVLLQWQRVYINAVDCVSDCHSVCIMTTCMYIHVVHCVCDCISVCIMTRCTLYILGGSEWSC